MTHTAYDGETRFSTIQIFMPPGSGPTGSFIIQAMLPH